MTVGPVTVAPVTVASQARAPVTRLVDIVFPGDTNHHGTLFGGVGLAHMDKVAFITAARHAPVDFVTASCERIDFEAPANMGELIELTGRILRVGRRSLAVEVTLAAEALLTGERRRCARGVFNMVAVGKRLEGIGGSLPPLPPIPAPEAADGSADDLRLVDIVFPGETSHYGSLYGGNALVAMNKAAFVAATRHSRQTVVMASSQRTDFQQPIHQGEVMETIPRVIGVGHTSMTVEVELWAENLHRAERRLCGRGEFTMVAVDDERRPTPVLTPAI